MEFIWLKPLLASELALVLETKKLVVVHCWASWNAHDRPFAIAIKNVRQEFVDSVEFYGFDIETAEGLCATWDVRNVPALVAFRSGLRFETTIAFCPGQPFEQQIREVLDRWTRRAAT